MKRENSQSLDTRGYRGLFLSVKSSQSILRLYQII